MSLKWREVKKWDDEHLTGWLLPVKWVLRAFSSITMAVTLMVLLVVYGVMASVPIGMLAMAPTYAVWALSLLACVAVGAGVPTAVALWAARRRGMGAGGRFALGLLMGGALAGASVWLWSAAVAPLLKYDPVTGAGVRFFAEFVERYKGEPLRRLPGLEMSELEFYAWWPLNVILYLFVTNMIVATARRIAFTFENIGVLTVHTGIVTVALGSAFYSLLKLEGDTILRSAADDNGAVTAGIGPAQDGFWDNTRTVLRVLQPPTRERPRWGGDEMELRGLPRYNAHGLSARGDDGGLVFDNASLEREGDGGRTLSVVPVRRLDTASGDDRTLGPIDADLTVRIVGYAPYVEGPLARSVSILASGAAGAAVVAPAVPDSLAAPAAGEPTLIERLTLLPALPDLRWSVPQAKVLGGQLAVEFLQGTSDARWAELRWPLVQNATAGPVPSATGHLIVSLPGQGKAWSGAVQNGQVVKVGAPEWTLEVTQLQSLNEMPFLTSGYEQARSSAAVVRVTPPRGVGAPLGPDGKELAPFTRYVYHRFPELNQDLSDELNERGMPKRGAASPAIAIAYLDTSAVQVYIDERPREGGGFEGPGARYRAIVRRPDGSMSVQDDLAEGGVVRVSSRLGLRLDGPREVQWDDQPLAGRDWSRVRARIVPEADRQKNFVGNHRKSMVAVEVAGGGVPGAPAWRVVRWLRYREYARLAPDALQAVALPDGRTVSLGFGRMFHPFGEGMLVRLANFDMKAYAFSSLPSDFRSDLLVLRGPEPTGQSWRSRTNASTSMNNPLLISPLVPDASLGWLENVRRSIAASVGPLSYKLSQNSWDRESWERTSQMAASIRAVAGEGLVDEAMLGRVKQTGAVPAPFVDYQLAALAQMRAGGLTNEELMAMQREGQWPRAFVRYTVLGVGNNPGYVVIFGGGVLIALGIPWAFYIKPWIVRRRSAKLRAEHSGGGKGGQQSGAAPVEAAAT